jgi:hypothetical protein
MHCDDQRQTMSENGPSRQLVQRTDMSGVEVRADIARTSLFGR